MSDQIENLIYSPVVGPKCVMSEPGPLSVLYSEISLCTFYCTLPTVSHLE